MSACIRIQLLQAQSKHMYMYMYVYIYCVVHVRMPHVSMSLQKNTVEVLIGDSCSSLTMSQSVYIPNSSKVPQYLVSLSPTFKPSQISARILLIFSVRYYFSRND